MSDSPTVNRASRVIAKVSPQLPADAALREEMRAHNRISPAEQHAVVRAVYSHYRWFGWLDQNASLQSRLAHAISLQDRFDADPLTVKPEALAARALPTWLADEVELSAEYLRQIQAEPTLWIRAQAAHFEALLRSLPGCEPGPEPTTTALRYTGKRDLFKTDEFRHGLFEIQDLGSQLVSLACAPQPGETWWDACAGEGGKLLHMSDLMQNKGLIWASDRSHRRIAQLRKRASRAQAYNYRVVPWNGGPIPPTKTKFDGILLDAPCSGVGTWQRHPHHRWTVTPTDVAELASLQAQLLDHVAPSLKPGGRLIYAVCTLTKSETTAIAETFSANHPEFEPLPLLDAEDHQLTIWPQDWNANGMFIAGWKRT